MTPVWLALVSAAVALPGLFFIALLVVGGRGETEDLRQLRLGSGEVGRMLGPSLSREEGARRPTPSFPWASAASLADSDSVVDPPKRLGDPRFSP